jgi:dTDP-4-dehydrorhamnose reductase
MLARARAGTPLSVVEDQTLAPTYTPDLAAAIVEAIHANVTGVLHLTASGVCSWHQFTLSIMSHAGLDVEVTPSRTVVGPGGIDRPLNGVLARPRADALGLTPLRSWDSALEAYMNDAGLAAAGDH